MQFCQTAVKSCTCIIQLCAAVSQCAGTLTDLTHRFHVGIGALRQLVKTCQQLRKVAGHRLHQQLGCGCRYRTGKGGGIICCCFSQRILQCGKQGFLLFRRKRAKRRLQLCVTAYIRHQRSAAVCDGRCQRFAELRLRLLVGSACTAAHRAADGAQAVPQGVDPGQEGLLIVVQLCQTVRKGLCTLVQVLHAVRVLMKAIVVGLYPVCQCACSIGNFIGRSRFLRLRQAVLPASGKRC